MPKPLEIDGGPIEQASWEEISYLIDTTNAGGSPTDPTCVAYRVSDETIVTSTVLSGTPSVDGNNVVTPTVKSLSKGQTYRIQVGWTAGGRKLGVYFIIRCPV